MNRVMCGAVFAVMVSATAALAGMGPVEVRAEKTSRDDVHLAEFKIDMKFRWSGHWVWPNGRTDNTSSYEWLKAPTARYCYDNGCQTVTHTTIKNSTVDTFTTADGGYFEFRPSNGGLQMAGSYWRGGRQARAKFPPDATATFHADGQKPAPAPKPPATSGNLKWVGKMSWARVPSPNSPRSQPMSIELLQNSQVRLCFDAAVPATCNVYPYKSGNASYTLSRGQDYFDIRLVESSLFGQYWWSMDDRTRVSPDGTFLLKQQK